MAQEIRRCPWPNMDNPKMVEYHDKEWGKLNLDDHYLFELLTLELFQSGLSWQTVLNKRDNFRKAFDQFDLQKVSKYDDQKVEQLMNDAGIIRNKRKILATIANSKAILKVEARYGTFGKFLQKFVPKPIINHPLSAAHVPASSPESEQISKALKKEGFKFVGPVTIYSFMQGCGLINDHLDSCSFKFK